MDGGHPGWLLTKVVTGISLSSEILQPTLCILILKPPSQALSLSLHFLH